MERMLLPQQHSKLVLTEHMVLPGKHLKRALEAYEQVGSRYAMALSPRYEIPGTITHCSYIRLRLFALRRSGATTIRYGDTEPTLW